MNEQKIDEIKNAVRELIQVIIQEGKPLSDKMKMNIALVMEQAAKRIQQLRQEEQQTPTDGLSPSQPQEPELSSPMQSSNVHSFGYDDKTGRLLVKFQGDYPQENGPIYGYSGVPKNIFNLFRQGAIPARTTGKNAWGRWWKGKNPSLGSSLYTLVKNGGYQYQKLS
jgi:hypothetical protein